MAITYIGPYYRGRVGHWSIFSAINGGLAGMVAACAGCNNMPQWAAFITGLIAGFNFYWYSQLLLKYQIDDLLDAFPVHFGGGVIGIMFAPMFMYDGIWYYKGNACTYHTAISYILY